MGYASETPPAHSPWFALIVVPLHCPAGLVPCYVSQVSVLSTLLLRHLVVSCNVVQMCL